nr:NAD(P)H-binding protein [Mycolicibacterium malmesburyense]CRL73660.1 putative nucleoside-diphosphate sugar epimerase [Mycolicibacterium malmesburyense]
MARTVLVTGATGTLGHRVVPEAIDAGHDVRALSRKSHVGYTGVHWAQADLLTGTGLDAALDGIEVVVNCATQPTGGKDVTAMRNLVASARRAGVAHTVHVSIVGIDRIPLPYYRTKLRAEQVLEGSGLGHTVLRATQFHDLIRTIFALQRYSPVLGACRGVSFQPIDTADVAARLVELLDTEPAGRAPDIGGPAVHTHTELGRMYLDAAASRRRVLAVPLPGRIGRELRGGANLVPQNPVGTVGFAEYLAARD